MLFTIIVFFSSLHFIKGDQAGLCKFKNLPTHDNSNANDSVCDNMVPRNGLYPPQGTPSPWRIFTYRDTIEQLHSQPVTLGSEDSTNLFNGYVITAQAVDSSDNLGDIIGHFEPQWDAKPICCGDTEYPNMLESASIRVRLPNQTFLWTAPDDYEGHYVIVATVWKSIRLYWPNMRSHVMQVIPRVNQTKPH